MDLQETIRQLEIQKRKVELVIAELEQLQGDEGGAPPPEPAAPEPVSAHRKQYCEPRREEGKP
jgi:hypothetical protein